MLEVSINVNMVLIDIYRKSDRSESCAFVPLSPTPRHTPSTTSTLQNGIALTDEYQLAGNAVPSFYQNDFAE